MADGVFAAAVSARREGRARLALWTCTAAGLLAAALTLEARTVRTFYRNERPALLRVHRGGPLGEWVEWLKANVPPDGRVAFAGRAVHAYGGGNTAYLPVLTGLEMMGDDYYGFPRRTIEYNYPPRAYRELGEDGWRAFTELHGITHWVAVNGSEIGRLRSMEDWLEEVASFHVANGGYDIVVFAVRGARGGRFLEGSGRVEADFNRLRVETSGPAVLRYNWRNGLVCRTPGAAIAPVPVDDHLRFISVDPGTNAVVEIGYKAHWAGVEPNFDGRFHH